MQLDKIVAVIEAARADGRDVLLENEGLEILVALGIAVPAHLKISGVAEAHDIRPAALPSNDAVVKVLSPDIQHKSEAGGIAFVPNDRTAITEAVRKMERDFADSDVRGFIIAERISYDASLGGEILMGIRWTDDFGPVVSCGAGGVHTEFVAANLKPGREIAIATPADLAADALHPWLDRLAVTRLMTNSYGGQTPRVDRQGLVDVITKFARLAQAAFPHHLTELEVNPFVVSSGRLLALDVLARCPRRKTQPIVGRPLHKLRNLLQPRSIAIVGVSERLNPGHIILNNLIREGFDTRRVFIVKPGSESIAGCRCYPDVAALPERVDLLVLSVAAAQVPDLLGDVIAAEKAESVIVIPGGLEEKSGSEAIVGRMRAALDRSRASDWGGPVINGGNSMGIRSQPGRCDTTFIPGHKLHPRESPTLPLALISQSGAFIVAKSSKLGFRWRYAISIGNQMDLTIGDYLTYLKDDTAIEVYAVYAEGFKPLDGMRFLEAAKSITAEGRTVILYRGGRRPEGAAASASHTAAIAGDYVVCRELAKNAGVIVAETTADFEDLVSLYARLGPRKVAGRRLGAISNAGFECVSIADHLGGFELATLSQPTRAGLSALLREYRLEGVVDVRNPVDITPIMPDAPYEEAVRLVLRDDNVDVALIGCVPLTGALQTLAPGAGHDEDVFREDSIAHRLIRLKEEEVSKPWVVVVDGGPLYDPMARLLEDHGIPTFRTADRALRLLNTFCNREDRP
ncbi:MAG: acetate--CoA ligase family protein [Gemmatimonadota bacterium]|nr:MAG: acetate--CoA ligase family protein [Gemmatimonadota bacterium]